MPLSILGLASWLSYTGNIALLGLGFGFVIFWHELGHFLAAKWVGIKVEQFAVGFGQALFAWRKGVGFRLGNTQKDYRERIESHLAQSKKAQLTGDNKAEFTDIEMSAAAEQLGLGDTEYRLNWIPLGGYVKMLGQDDLRPDAVAEDPRAFNRKSVGARMIVISAGVVMNVILAGILFIVVFMMGLKVPPAWVGNILPQSPAQKAGIQVGDHIKMFDGKPQEDFTKIKLNTALAKPGHTVPITIERFENGVWKEHDFQITPGQPEGNSGFVALGFSPPQKLMGLPKGDADTAALEVLQKNAPADEKLIKSGDVIVTVNGQPVNVDDFAVLERSLQEFGKAVELGIKGTDGVVRRGTVQPHFTPFFDGTFNFAGIVPRAQVYSVQEASAAFGKLQNGDVIISLTLKAPGGNKVLPHPTHRELVDNFSDAGSNGQSFDLTVLRKDATAPITISDLKAIAPVGDEKFKKGLGVELLFCDELHVTVADVLPTSPASSKLQRGDTIMAINSTPVANWYDVHRLFDGAKPDEDMQVSYTRDGKPGQTALRLNSAQLAEVGNIRYDARLALISYEIDRRAPSTWVAAKWGVSETRDFLLQFYLTLRRMTVEHSVPLKNLMGPVGIFQSGMNISSKGTPWLLWFLAMISANLAVVNFLPIPVVDGGHFVFLLIEKIKGKPLSNKAMAIAQYAGLAFLMAVVVFVTYHDIMRRT